LVSFLAVVVMLFIIVKILQEVHNHVSWRRVRTTHPTPSLITTASVEMEA
jgi:hypothetical protein